jgi:hypothetical protein
VAVGGAGAALVGGALMFLGWRQSVACAVRMQEGGSQDPFECVGAGAPFLVGGVFLAGAGLLTGLIGGAVALIGR